MPAEQLVSVGGTVNLSSREGGIHFVNPVSPRAARPSPFGPDGADGRAPVVLRILQDGGTPPREIPVVVEPAPEPAPGDDRTGLVDVVVSAGPGPQAVELGVAGRVVATLHAARPRVCAPPATRAPVTGCSV